MENKNGEHLNLGSGTVIVNLEQQNQLLRQAKEIQAKKGTTFYDSYFAGTLLGERLEKECKMHGSCSFKLFVHEDVGLHPVIDVDGITSVLKEENGFDIVQEDNQKIDGGNINKNPHGVHMQHEPEIEVFSIKYTKPKSFLSNLFGRK